MAVRWDGRGGAETASCLEKYYPRTRECCCRDNGLGTKLIVIVPVGEGVGMAAAVDDARSGEHVFDARFALLLDNPLRRWLMRQRKMVAEVVRAGMTVVDVGCGSAPLLFDLLRAVGPTGRVICADLQPAMLERVERKARRRGALDRVRLHQCAADRVGLEPACADLVIAFWMVHETPDSASFIREMAETLRPGGELLIVEPGHHVGPDAVEGYVRVGQECGLELMRRPKVRWSRTLLLQQGAVKA